VLLSSIAVKDEIPKSAWLVSKMGRVTAGVQFEPQSKNYSFRNISLGVDFFLLKLHHWIFKVIFNFFGFSMAWILNFGYLSGRYCHMLF